MDYWKAKNGILQIYPRSYKDSDGDGVGDLRGIIEQLPYIKGETDSLGIDAIWLSPIYTSPMADFGYDVSDYCGIDPVFGTMDDFKELIAKAHDRDISVMLDIVPNHTSDQHPWFQEALADPSSPKRDYYVFKKFTETTSANNWLSVFGGSAWEKIDGSDEYYLHTFLKEQPDLNWSNPAVQEEFRDIIRFWCELGVDGFRADAVRWMAKDPNFEDDTLFANANPDGDPYDSRLHDKSRFFGQLEEYLKVLSQAAAEYENVIVLFEDYIDPRIDTKNQIERLYSVDSAHSAPFNFQLINGKITTHNIAKIAKQYKLVPDDSAMVLCLGNHDSPRLATRVGSEMAKVIALVQMTLPGIPVVYYGEEIGMTNVDVPPEKTQDRFEQQVPGKGLGRDPSRTPMQWHDGHNAGFTTSDEPWLHPAAVHDCNTVGCQAEDEMSFWRLYRDLLKIRSEHTTLRTGIYQEVYVDDDLIIYTVTDQYKALLVVASFCDGEQSVELPEGGVVLRAISNRSYEHQPSQEVSTIVAFEAVLIDYGSNKLTKDKN